MQLRRDWVPWQHREKDYSESAVDVEGPVRPLPGGRALDVAQVFNLQDRPPSDAGRKLKTCATIHDFSFR